MLRDLKIYACILACGLFLYSCNQEPATSNDPDVSDSTLKIKEQTHPIDTFSNKGLQEALDTTKGAYIVSPLPNTSITSPVQIKGFAKGNWYFEAVANIAILDAHGKPLGKGIAQAQSEWMTNQFVPFEGNIKFENPKTDSGKIVILKSNPSGMPENNDSIIMPIKFRR